MSDKESRVDACDECCPKERDFSKKTVYKCELCNRWFCERHVEPRLAYIKDWRAIDDSPEMRAFYYAEMQREDGHPDFEYSRRRITGLGLEEIKRNKLIKQALDGMNHYYHDEPLPEKPVDEVTARKRTVEILQKEEEELDKEPQIKTSEKKLLNKNYFPKKHRNLMIASLVLIVAVVILIAPIIPTQHTVTKTRTRSLRYSSELYYHSAVGSYSGYAPFVNVTNKDSVGGSFSVTIKYWNDLPQLLDKPSELVDTFSKSMLINAGATQQFSAPSSWIVMSGMYSCTYSVSAPSTQETYNATQTEYKSLLNLIESRLNV